MSTTETALTVHLVRPDGAIDDRFLASVTSEIEAHFKISHAAIQVERDGAMCRQAPDDVV